MHLEKSVEIPEARGREPPRLPGLSGGLELDRGADPYCVSCGRDRHTESEARWARRDESERAERRFLERRHHIYPISRLRGLAACVEGLAVGCDPRRLPHPPVGDVSVLH